jgi:hypothetical protein
MAGSLGAVASRYTSGPREFDEPAPERTLGLTYMKNMSAGFLPRAASALPTVGAPSDPEGFGEARPGG